MHKNKKIEQVSHYKEVFSNAKIVILSHNNGLTVNQDRELRNNVKKVGAKYAVAKNNLLKLAVEESPFAALTEKFSGPTTISYADDPVALAKELTGFSKDNEKLEVVAGLMDDGKLLERKDVERLASMPTLDESRAKIVGILSAPASKIARIVSAPASQLVNVTKAYGEQQ